MRGAHSYMGWSHIPDINTPISIAEDNPFAAHKKQTVGKGSVTLPTDDWLCIKMEGGSESGGLQWDQFVKSKSQVKFVKVNHWPSGTGYTQTRTDQPVLCHSGTVTLQNSTVHTAA